jgi:predicted nucleic acid-binding protein
MAKPTIYIDACCIIEALKKRRGLSLDHPESEVDMIERVMRAAREGEIDLHTSIITLAEVVHLGQTPPPADLKPYVERLLLSGRDGIIATAPTPQIILLARDLAVEENILGGVADRIHVATSMTVGATEFLTVDARLSKRMANSNLRGLRVILPSQTSLLPGRFLQHDIFNQPQSRP